MIMNYWIIPVNGIHESYSKEDVISQLIGEKEIFGFGRKKFEKCSGK